jgi:hypothetical protein
MNATPQVLPKEGGGGVRNLMLLSSDDLDAGGDKPIFPKRCANGGVMLWSFENPKACRAPRSRACPPIQRRQEAFDDMKRRISSDDDPAKRRNYST